MYVRVKIGWYIKLPSNKNIAHLFGVRQQSAAIRRSPDYADGAKHAEVKNLRTADGTDTRYVG